MGARSADISRKTNETEISVSISVDGTGKHSIATGIGFFDHMLDQVARHGLIDLEIDAHGDLHIDGHHTVEDVGITLGQAVALQGSLIEGLQPAALGQLGGLQLGEGPGPDHSLISSIPVGGSGSLQIGRGHSTSSRAGLRAFGLQLPSLPLQQAGDRGAVGVALAVALGPQLSPGSQPGAAVVATFQLAQQGITHGAQIGDQLGRVGGPASHP